MVLLNFSLLFFYMNCFTSIKLLLNYFLLIYYGFLKIMRDLCQTSSDFSLELYWIGCQLCETNHFLLFLIFLIYAIFVVDLLTLVHFQCTRVSLF